MNNIRSDAKRNVNLLTNLDKLRSRYYDTDVNTGASVIFPSFEIYAFEHNLFKLMATASKIPFKLQWTQRPDYVSYEFYKNTMYWPLILYTNQIDNREDFRGLDTILVPLYESILDVIKYRVPASDISQINPAVKNTAMRYYTSFPLDDSYLAKKRADTAIAQSKWEESTVEMSVPTHELDGGTFV